MNNLVNRKELFWDVNPEQIARTIHESDEWAIIRVFEYGEIEDIFDAIELFGEKKVREVLSREKLKPVTAVMAYLFLGIDRYNRYAS